METEGGGRMKREDAKIIRYAVKLERQWLELSALLEMDGPRIAALCLLESGLSLRKFAAKIQISPAYLCRVLKGQAKFTIELARNFAALAGEKKCS